MDLFQAIKNRRSIRKFSDKNLNLDSVKELIEFGSWAPNACNRQLWNFIIIDKKTIEKNKNIFQMPYKINTNTLIAVTYDERFNADFYANVQSASAAIQNILLAATAKGIGSLWMAERTNESKIRKFLNIPKNQILISFICLGYCATQKIFVPSRRPLKDIIHINKYNSHSLFPTTEDPTKWSLEEITNCVNFSIRAKSPSKEFYTPVQEREYKKLLSQFPVMSGKCLIIYDFLGDLSFDLIKLKKVNDLTIHVISEDIKKFIIERFINESIDIKKINFLIGDLLKINKEVFDNIIVFKKLEKFPNPKIIIDKIVGLSKKDTNIYLVFENKYNLYTVAKRTYRALKKIHKVIFGKSFDLADSVGFFGPFKELSPKTIRKIIKNNTLEKRSDIGLDLIPGIKTNSGPPFWGKKIVPSTFFESLTTRSFFRHIFKTRIVKLRVK